MDERLPLGSWDAATLRMVLEQERSKREELTQEVARLRAGLSRQNDRRVCAIWSTGGRLGTDL